MINGCIRSGSRAILIIGGLVLSLAIFASAAANTVPETGVDLITLTVSIENLIPAECPNINYRNTITGSGTINGSNNDDLILGSDLSDTISAKSGDDCVVGRAEADLINGNSGEDTILGGGGADTINGNNGNDVIYGGPGDDTIDGGKNQDVCYGGDGVDTFINCETEFQ